jgi:hypothetical protein
MIRVFCLAVAFSLAAAGEPPSPPPAEAATADVRPDEALVRLLDVRRVFVDRLGGGEVAAQIRDMIITSLQASKLFIITENESRADAFLRGSAEDLIFTDAYASSDGVNGRAYAGVGSNPDRNATNRRSRSLGVTVGENESTRIEERKHEATASVRIVGKDGDVLWSTTQESAGGKFRGAGADVADKVARQLLKDYEEARRLRAAGR